MASRTRIGLNFRLAHHGWLGGFYYLQNLALAVASLPDDERPELVGLVPRDDPAIPRHELEQLDRVVGFSEGDPRRELGVRVRNRSRRLAATLTGRPWGIEAVLADDPVDVLFPAVETGPHSQVRPLPWVYDLQHVDLPDYFSERELEKRTRLFRQLAEHAPLIVVSSRAAAERFQGLHPGASPRLRVLRFTTVPTGAWLNGDPRAAVGRYGLPARFLLLPNQFWAHKNHRVAFDAVRVLRDRGEPVCLVCTGATEDSRNPAHFDELRAFLAEHRLDEHVRILGAVPRADYVQLLRAAAAVVQPSLFEGWSSTVEDARALGKRLVLSDLDVHREQSPEGSLFFPRADSGALADRLLEAVGENGGLGEREALARQHARVLDYARTFTAIVRERLAVGSERG